jgi:hypothetical protein
MESAKVHSWGRKMLSVIPDDSSPEIVEEVERLVI